MLDTGVVVMQKRSRSLSCSLIQRGTVRLTKLDRLGCLASYIQIYDPRLLYIFVYLLVTLQEMTLILDYFLSF